MNTTFGQRLKLVLENLKNAGREVTIADLAKRADVSPQAVYRWLSDIDTPREYRIRAIAPFLGTTVSYLRDGIENKGVVPVETVSSHHIAKIDLDSVRGKEFSALMAQVAQSPKTITARFDCSYNSFAFEVTDASNSPRFAPGDIVVIDTEQVPIPGDYVLARTLYGEYLFRRYREFEGGFALEPENGDWPTLYSATSPLQIIGTMKEHTIPRRR